MTEESERRAEEIKQHEAFRVKMAKRMSAEGRSDGDIGRVLNIKKSVVRQLIDSEDNQGE